MRRILLLTLPLLLIPYLATGTQQPTQNTLPNPADFVEASLNCKRRVKMSPWVGTPGVDWPKTYRCVLEGVHTFDGVKTFSSSVRPGGTGMCSDFWKVHQELASREICCDRGTPEENQPPKEKPTPEPKCEPPTPWFDASSGCEESRSPQLVISGATATLYMCGYAVFSYTDASLRDQLIADAYKSAMRDQLLASSSSKICCDKFNEAVKTGKPCDPRADLDCDGRPNNTDRDDFKMPAIDSFIRPVNAAIDPFPYLFDTQKPDFLPNLTARESKGVGDCPCKWELMKGELKCSPDGKQEHYYKATWKCPSTGAEVLTVKYAPATAPCEKDVR